MTVKHNYKIWIAHLLSDGNWIENRPLLTYGSASDFPPSSDWLPELGNGCILVQPGVFLLDSEEPRGRGYCGPPRGTNTARMHWRLYVRATYARVLFRKHRMFNLLLHKIFYYFIHSDILPLPVSFPFKDYRDDFSRLADSEARVPKAWVDGHGMLGKRIINIFTTLKGKLQNHVYDSLACNGENGTPAIDTCNDCLI